MPTFSEQLFKPLRVSHGHEFSSCGLFSSCKIYPYSMGVSIVQFFLLGGNSPWGLIRLIRGFLTRETDLNMNNILIARSVFLPF
jgi:hypothetical protein